MNTSSPQWQNDEGAQPVRIRTKSVQPNLSRMQTLSPNVPRANRKGAALVGIALFVLMGVTLAGGLQGLWAQVSDTPYVMRITKDGMSPASLTVTPGATITWKNEDAIPHILSSDTLPTADKKPYESSAMFPGASTHILIPSDAAAGTYTVGSKTAQNVVGQIIIEAVAATGTVTALPTMPTTTGAGLSTDSVVPVQGSLSSPASSAAATSSTTSESTSTPDLAASTLPYNPHNIVNGEATIEPLHGGAPSPSPIIGGHFKPSSQPESGPEVWIVVGLSIGSFLLLTRKQLLNL